MIYLVSSMTSMNMCQKMLYNPVIFKKGWKYAQKRDRAQYNFDEKREKILKTTMRVFYFNKFYQKKCDETFSYYRL